MPTLLKQGSLHVFFYSGDWREPPHVHVRCDNHIAKFWLDPVELEYSRGLNRSEIRRVEHIIKENQDLFLGQWNEFFND